jgi:predicted nucleic acid-binding protein
VVPPLWFLEIANGLLAAQRRKLLTPLERKTALKRLSELTYIVDEEAPHAAFYRTSDLADKHGLSVYDAGYLELALRRRLPLASRDAALRQAAKQHGLKVQG